MFKFIPLGQLSEAEKAAELAKLGRLLSEARTHTKHVPAPVIERTIRNALKTVRYRR